MSDQLTEAEAQTLFNQVSKGIKEDDNEKLTSLMNAETPVKEEVEETPAEETVEVVEETVETVEEPEKTDTDDTPPSDKTENVTEEKETEKPAEAPELAKLREELAKVTKDNHALRSQAGRVPHLQKRMKEIDAKLAELDKKAATPSDHPSTKINEKVLEKLKGIKETDPEIADVIAAVIAEATSGVTEDSIARERSILETQRNLDYSQYQALEAERLLEKYPNAPEVFASPAWKEWKAAQPKGIQSLASSDNADDVELAFERYAKDMLAKYPELAEKKEVVDESAPADAVKNEAAEKLEAERKRKKETAANAKSPNAPAKVKLPDDPQALFDHYSKQIRKEITGG